MILLKVRYLSQVVELSFYWQQMNQLFLFMLAYSAIDSDLLVVNHEWPLHTLDVNKLIHQNTLISVMITWCVNCSYNSIDCEGSGFAIGKFNVIMTAVYNGIIMGITNDISLSIVLTSDLS